MTQRRSMPNPFPGIFNPKPSVSSTTSSLPKISKAGTNGSLIAIVLDESGSMSSCLGPTIEGYNQYIGEQKKLNPESTKVTLCKFEGGHTRYPYTNLNILEVPNLTSTSYVPAGGTNLMDAIGKTIIETNAYLKGLKKKERPAVFITIITDGAENSSREFNSTQIKELVHLAEKGNWAFQFLGANIDAFAVGSTFGMNFSNSASYSVNNMAQTMRAASAVTSRVRTAQLQGSSTSEVYASAMYTADERKDIGGK